MSIPRYEGPGTMLTLQSPQYPSYKRPHYGEKGPDAEITCVNTQYFSTVFCRFNVYISSYRLERAPRIVAKGVSKRRALLQCRHADQSLPPNSAAHLRTCTCGIYAKSPYLILGS